MLFFITLNLNLKTDSISRLLWYYSIPSLIGTLANALYNIVDRVYIGQGVGAMAIAGLAITFPIMNIIAAFGMLVGQGSAANLSLKLGKGDVESANKILPNALYLIIFFNTLTTLCCFLFLEPILRAFGGSEATIPYAKEYLQIIIPFNVFSTLGFSFANIIRASGRPMVAMYTLVIGAVLNVAIDPIFIFWLDMGIRGAAIATVISMMISATWVLWHFNDKKMTVRFRKSLIKPDFKIIAAIASIGLSPFMLQICTSLVNIIINHSLHQYGGDLAIGAFGVVSSFVLLITMAVIGLSQGMQPIVGYNYGAKEYGRVKETLKLATIIATVITTIGSIIGVVFPSAIARCFTKDPELIGITSNAVRIYLSLYSVVGFHIICTNYFQSIGRAWISILLSTSRQILFLIPIVLILPHFYQLNGVWWSQPIANFFATLMALVILYKHIKYKLKHNI